MELHPISLINTSLIIQKYRDTALMFDDLAKTFLERSTAEVLNIYSHCLENVSCLQEMEQQPHIMTYLKNLEVLASWQKRRFELALEFESHQIIEGDDSHSDEEMPLVKVSSETIAPVTTIWPSAVALPPADASTQSVSAISVVTTPQPFTSSRPSITTSTKKFCKNVNGGDKREEGRRSLIESTLVTLSRKSKEGLSSIAGLAGAKALLKKTVLLPIRFPHLFTGGRKPVSNILLFGPPGTGKTRLAHALAADAAAKLYSVSSAHLLSSWFGESEKMIRDLFEVARKNADKSIIFIDEVDSICRKRSEREGEAMRSMKNQLLIELDGNADLDKSSSVICATNCPWELDLAFLRRFHLRIYIPLPDKVGRRELIERLSRGVGVRMSPSDWEELAKRTEGYTGSDLVTLVTTALHYPLDDLLLAGNFSEQCSKDKSAASSTDFNQVSVRDVTPVDFSKALLQTPKTIPKAEIERFLAYTSHHGI